MVIPQVEGNCIKCNGSGDCPACKGTALIKEDGVYTTCFKCKGSGKCETCGGLGRVL